MHRISLQVKFGLSYISIIVVVLVVMNTYPLLVSENLVFRSKETALKNSVTVMASALSGYENLTEETIARTMELTQDTDISRVLVTDVTGLVLYDSRETEASTGRYVLYAEIVQALRGYDAFSSEFSENSFHSRAASPVLYRNQIIGAVYAYEYDTQQAMLLLTLHKNLLTISASIAVAVAFLSLLLSHALTRRFDLLAEAIRQIREGAYSHRAVIAGHDEITQIAQEFNALADRLQKTENARRQFVSDASHELKTPLAGIQLLSDSILQTEQMEEKTVREFVGDIGQEAQRLTRITENLLRLTRLDSGVEIGAEPVHVVPLAEHVVRMLRLVAQERGIVVRTEFLWDGCVRINEDALHQILYNLLENAIKYNRPGGFVCVTLDGTEERCILTVADDGIGIPQEDRERIFDRFYRVDKARSRADGGTGLGLAIVRDTVRYHGGTISVLPREGGGSRFIVQFPAERVVL